MILPSTCRSPLLGAPVLLLVGLTLGTRSLPAQTSTWTGAVNGDWGAPGNWSAAPAFNGADQLRLSNLVNPTQTLGATRAVNTLTFSQGGFTVSGNALTFNNAGAGLFSTGNNTVASGVYPYVPTTLRADAGTLTLGGIVYANGGAAAPTFEGAGNFNVSGSFQGPGGPVMNGTGVLLLSGTNYFAGATTVNAGTLKLAAATTLATSSALILNAGGAFDLNGVNPTVPLLNGAGTVLLGANTLTLTAPANGYYTPNFSGPISGSGGLVIQLAAGATQILSGTSAYTGGTTVKSGFLSYPAEASLGAATGSLTLDGGGLKFADSITLTRALTVGAGGGTLSTAAGTVSRLPAVISGTGPVTYGNAGNAEGTWIPTAGYTYSGLTTVSAGALAVTASPQLGDAANAVSAGGGTLLLREGVTISGRTLTLTGRGGSTADYSGALVGSTGANVWAGPVVVPSSGRVGVQAGSSLVLSGPVSGGGTLDVFNAGDALISGSVNTAINKAYAGTLTLSGNNASSGSFFVTQGTLVLQGGNAVADNATVQLSAGAALRLEGNETFANLLDYSPGAAVDLGSFDLSLNSGGSFSGTISGTGRLLMKGAGTLNLSGVNTFSGGLYVDSGTLRVAADASLGAANNPVFLRGGTLRIFADNFPSTTHALNVTTADVSLDISSGTFTLDQGLTNAGSLSKLGAGTLVLTGANAYAGGTVLTAGTVSVSADAQLGQAGGGLSFQGGTLRVTGTTFHDTPRPVTFGDAYSGFEVTDAANTFTLGQIAGPAGGIIKRGAGTLVLSAATNLAYTVASEGTLRFGVSGAVSATGSLASGPGARLDLQGFNQTTLNLSASGEVSTGTGTLTVTNLIYDNQATGTISGRLALGGNNVSFSSNPGATPAAGLNVAAAISGSGSITKVNNGLIILSGTNPFTGSVLVNAGTLRVTGSLLNTTGVSVAKGALLEVAAGRLGVSGNVVNSGFLRLTDSATLTATGTITNNGVLDLSRWNGVLPANFVNNPGGIILDAAAVRVSQVARSATSVQTSVNARAGLTYQLQRATSLVAADWTNVGQPQTAAANGPLLLTDGNPANPAQGFYRVVISQAVGNSGH